MPRPKPDKIVRHQIVFGEADRKILSAAVDSYNLNTIMGNVTKILNDVTGTITLLTLLAATGALGLVFAFNVSPVHLASGNVPAIIMSFNQQWTDASNKKKEEDGLTREERMAKMQENPLGFASAVSSNPLIDIANFYSKIQFDNISSFDNPFK
jgi:hypothetical protein